MQDAPLASKLDRARALISARQAFFACPICGEPIRADREASVRCAQGHCFDVARKGYVNFARAGKLPHYGRALFEARSAVFQAGYYAPVTGALQAILGAEAERLGRPLQIVDAGCGEGYYSASLASGGHSVFGIDLSRDAVALATLHAQAVCWCVADLARLPFADRSLDAVLNVLTPANYGEFRRVLRPGGLCVKVVPAGGYLKEIRAAVQQPPYDNNEVVAYFHAHLDDVTNTPLRYVRTLDETSRDLFFHMTPLTAGQEADPAALREICQITIDMNILTGRFSDRQQEEGI